MVLSWGASWQGCGRYPPKVIFTVLTIIICLQGGLQGESSSVVKIGLLEGAIQ